MRWSRSGTFLLAVAFVVTAAAPKEAALRARMVKEQIEDRGVTNAAVLAAMRKVPRHEFVPDAFRDLAYVDAPLAIGHGQTISQPYIVAVMTELLRVKPTDQVLEIGTGSGYQAAVLAEIAAEVYTIEIIEPLAKAATDRLQRLGYPRLQPWRPWLAEDLERLPFPGRLSPPDRQGRRWLTRCHAWRLLVADNN